MLVGHHVLPLASGHRVAVVVVGQLPVLFEELLRFLQTGGGARAALFRERVGFGEFRINLRRACARHDRIIHQLIEHVGVFGRHFLFQRLGAFGDLLPVRRETVRLVVVHGAPDARLLDFRLADVVQADILRDQHGAFLRVFGRKDGLAPVDHPGADFVIRDLVGVPGVIHDEVDLGFLRFQVAHVDDPQPAHAVLVRDVQLMPDLRDRTRADPAVVPRTAVHVDVVIQPQAFGGFPVFFGGQLEQIAEIAVADRHDDVVRGTHATVVEDHDLVEDHPYLRHGGGVASVRLADELALIVEEQLVQQLLVAFEIRAGVKRQVAVAAQPDSRHVVVLRVALQALQPELPHVLAVLAVVPLAELAAALRPFLLVAHQRLVVTGAHHDAVLVRHDWVQRVVLVERLAPHRGPQIVAFEAQDKLEHVRVHLRIDAAEISARPVAERRFLVVDEDAAVFHFRRVLHVVARLRVQTIRMHNGHVRPPVPRGNADALRQLVDTVDRAAFVAACNDHGVGRDPDHVRFPLALDRIDIEHVLLHEAVDERAFPDRADQNCAWARLTVRFHGRRRPGHAFYVFAQVLRRADDLRKILFAQHDGRGLPIGEDTESAFDG